MSERQRKPRLDSERCAIVNRTVTFNVADAFQRELLDYADTWVNFSGAIKRLLANQLRGNDSRTPLTLPAFPDVTNEETQIDDPLESASGLW